MVSKQKSIFFTVCIWFFLILLVFVFVFSVMYYRSIVDQVSNLVYSALQRSAYEIAISTDENINEIDQVALELLRMYTAQLPEQSESAESAESTAGLQFLQEYVHNNRNVDQAEITLPNHIKLTAGLYDGVFTQPDSVFYQMGNLLHENQAKMIYYDKAYSDSGLLFSSYGRGFMRVVQKGGATAADQPPVFVDVKKSVTPILSKAEKYQSIYGEELYIFDQFHNQVFPYGKTASNRMLQPNQQNSYFSYIDENPKSTKLLEFSQDGSSEYLIYHYSPYSNLYTMFIISKTHLISNVSGYYMQFLPLMIALLISAGVISLLVAKIIARPINLIYSFIKRHDFVEKNLYLPDSIHSNILEVSTLIKSFHLMQEKINKAKLTQLELQKREMQSKMLSLQSQMNPHFLYNSLATMQAMANEGLNDEIVTMCQTTSRILRYISSDKESMVSLATEISHTQDYLECMRIRYGGDLQYQITVPIEMSEIPIPKLCLQLLVENAVKFMAEVSPPWHVRIHGALEYSLCGDRWALYVSDNGPGFPAERLEEIQQQIRQIDQTGLLPSLELKGMGLLNVYIRFRLTYGKGFTFQIQNMTPSGAQIILGGNFDEQEDF